MAIFDPKPSPQRLQHRLLQWAAVYAIGTVAGAVASYLRMPLPWMLGPFFVLAALSAAGWRARYLPMGRELGQVAIGLAIGLRFTPAVTAAVAAMLPQMLGATAYLLAVTTCAAFVFRRLAGVDPATAFFATAAGGVADMADVARRYDGMPSTVAVVHAMRVSMVVATAPFIVLQAVGQRSAAGGGATIDLAEVPLLVASLIAAYGMARLLKPTPLPNPWLVGPILTGIILALSGVGDVVVPGWLIIVAQVVLGAWLGCQYRRDLLTALPRVTAAAVVVAGMLIIMAAVGALILMPLSGLPFATAFLALAPAAVTEMVLVAKVLHLDAEAVAAFHVMRIAIVSTTVLGVFRIYTFIGRFKHGS